MSERSCGDCTLCCKLERIRELSKPRATWCQYCSIGKGCKVYESRPTACRDFRCLWLDDPQASEETRPDRLHFYAADAGNVIKVVVDPDYPEAWKAGKAAQTLHGLTQQGKHVLLMCGYQINFFPGRELPLPEEMIIDWIF